MLAATSTRFDAALAEVRAMSAVRTIAAYPPPALLELLAPLWAEVAATTYAAMDGVWPASTAQPLVHTSGAVALAQLRRRATACPTVSAAAQRWHQLVRRDAELPHPLTPHGRALRGTSRVWPGLGQLGDCLCASSLVFHEEPDEQPSTAA